MRERHGHPASPAGFFRDNLRRGRQRRILRERHPRKDRKKRLFFLFPGGSTQYKVGRKRSFAICLSCLLRKGKIAGKHAYKIHQGKLRIGTRPKVSYRKNTPFMRQYFAGTAPRRHVFGAYFEFFARTDTYRMLPRDIPEDAERSRIR